jgi:uncharacterized phage-associated protein
MNAITIARAFLKKAKAEREVIPIPKIHSLVYATYWMVVYESNLPLFPEEPHAYNFGPGFKSLENTSDPEIKSLHPKVEGIIKDIWKNRNTYYQFHDAAWQLTILKNTQKISIWESIRIRIKTQLLKKTHNFGAIHLKSIKKSVEEVKAGFEATLKFETAIQNHNPEEALELLEENAWLPTLLDKKTLESEIEIYEDWQLSALIQNYPQTAKDILICWQHLLENSK